MAKVEPELARYMVSKPEERDWVLSGAVGYLYDLELNRLPSQRLTGLHTKPHDSRILRPFANYSHKKVLSNCLLHLSESEDNSVQREFVASRGVGSEEGLLCITALQHAKSTSVVAHRLSKTGHAEERLWSIYVEFMLFCHSEAFVLHGIYREQIRRMRIDRNTYRDPAESYEEWRRKAAPARTELHPETLKYVRSNESAVVWREDRTEFHRQWIDKCVADGWKYGSRPYRL